ncbi:MAG TPA: Clp protease N-terminal domain-containing protein [Schlesneria sp.]|jgi:ATP-dependent Clp protease ATP-binding subunit ClpC
MIGFTDSARLVFEQAGRESRRHNHESVNTEHVLLGLVKDEDVVAAKVLKNLAVDLERIRDEVENLLQFRPEAQPGVKLVQSPRTKKVVEYAIEEARKLNHTYVGTEHILLGLLREPDGVGCHVLKNLGLTLEDVRKSILDEHHHSRS